MTIEWILSQKLKDKSSTKNPIAMIYHLRGLREKLQVYRNSFRKTHLMISSPINNQN